MFLQKTNFEDRTPNIRDRIKDPAWKTVEAPGAGSYSARLLRGALAQLVRAPPCHGGGCGFEPRRLRIENVQTRASASYQFQLRVIGRGQACETHSYTHQPH